VSWLASIGEEAKPRRITPYGSLFSYIFPSEKYVRDLGLGDELTPSVEYSLFIQVGRPKSGKTTAALSIASLVEDNFPDLKVRTVLSPSLPNCLRYIPEDAEVGVFLVDDAPVLHPAYGGRKFVDALNVATYFMMRHLARRRAPSIKYMLVVFNTQRYWSLDVAFREASDVDMFKSMVKEPREKKYLRRYLGKQLFDFLKLMHKEVFYRRNRGALNYFVYYTTWGRRGVGFLEGGPRRPANLFVDTQTRENMLERLFGLTGEYEAKALVLKIMEALGRLKVSWSYSRSFLNQLREVSEVRIADGTAHKAWKRGAESAIKTVAAE